MRLSTPCTKFPPSGKNATFTFSALGCLARMSGRRSLKGDGTMKGSLYMPIPSVWGALKTGNTREKMGASGQLSIAAV